MFESFDLVRRFTESWHNLQPNRNRRNVPVPVDAVPLRASTKKTEVERLRGFFAYCVENEWMTHNKAKDIKFKKKITKKFGLSMEEEQRFFGAVMHYHEYCNNTDEEAMREIHAFCLVLRWTGIRISDAAFLNDQQLVPRASGDGWAIKIYQKKTKEWVYIPVPSEVHQALSKLPFKGKNEGMNYWFWSGVGIIKTVTSNWYRRIIRIKKEAEIEGRFIHGLSPHTFRHTFSISHLNSGTDIKWVSRWLGHASITVTEEHYSHAIEETMLASERAYDESLKKQADRQAEKLRLKMTSLAKTASRRD